MFVVAVIRQTWLDLGSVVYYVTLGKLLNLFELWFPHLYYGDNIRAYQMDLLAQ